MLRGKLGPVRPKKGVSSLSIAPTRVQRVTVTVEVLPEFAKEALDHLLAEAYEFGTRLANPPF